MIHKLEEKYVNIKETIGVKAQLYRNGPIIFHREVSQDNNNQLPTGDNTIFTISHISKVYKPCHITPLQRKIGMHKIG